MQVGFRARLARAWDETHFRLRDLIVAAVSVVAVYLVLRTLSSTRAAWDEVIALLSGLAVVVAFRAADFVWNVAVAPYRMRIEELEEERASPPATRAATLQFGEPKLYRNESIRATAGGGIATQIGVQLWRVPLGNLEPDTKAENVVVKLVQTIPDIGLPAVDLHEAHDNGAPYRRTRDIRHGEPIMFDVVASYVGPQSEYIYLYRSDLGDSYAYRLSEYENNVVRGALWNPGGGSSSEGLTLVLQAFPDPPAKGHQVSYSLLYGAKARLVLRPARK